MCLLGFLAFSRNGRVDSFGRDVGCDCGNLHFDDLVYPASSVACLKEDGKKLTWERISGSPPPGRNLPPNAYIPSRILDGQLRVPILARKFRVGPNYIDF
jgi:hypothetical protein